MRKVLAIAAFSAISLAAVSASANGTVKPECAKPVHHKAHHHHKPHHVHHHEKHCAPACPPCPSLHSGFFAGLKGGYGWAKGKLKQDAQVTTNLLGVLNMNKSSQVGIDGGEIGLFLGYDRYFPNCWMLGIEGGAQWRNLSGKSNASLNSPANAASLAWNSRIKSDWSYDIAFRLGRKVYDCSLWYVKAGAQFTHFKSKTSATFTNTATGAVTTATGGNGNGHGHKKYRTGFLTGLGVEIPVACHWSLGAEYNFTWYQKTSINRIATNGTNDFVKQSIRPYENQLVARVIWKQ
jgi:opacity protein-like surface antigen